MTTTRIEDLLAHADVVRAVARAVLRDADRAADVEQETWLRATTRPPDVASRSWLSAVARTLALRSLRSDERRARRERAVASSESADRERAFKDVTEAVLGLDAQQREVVLLRYYEGLPPRRIAARIGVPVATVKKRQQRALEALRGRLERDLGDDWRASIGTLAGLSGSWLTRAGTSVARLFAGAPGEVVLASLLAVALAGGALIWLRGSEASGSPRWTEPAVYEDGAGSVDHSIGVAGDADIAPLTIRVFDGITREPIERYGIILHRGRGSKAGDWATRHFGPHPNGVLEIDPRSRGSHRLWIVQADGGYCESRLVTLDLNKQRPTRVEVPLYRERGITVRLVDPDGVPVKGSTVSLLEGGPGQKISWTARHPETIVDDAKRWKRGAARAWTVQRTDDRGLAVLRGPVGSENLVIRWTGSHLRGEVPVRNLPGGPLVLTALPAAELRVRVPEEHREWLCRPGPGSIQLEHAKTGALVRAHGLSERFDSAGVARLTGVPPGTYDVRIFNTFLVDRHAPIGHYGTAAEISPVVGRIKLSTGEKGELVVKPSPALLPAHLRARILVDGKPAPAEARVELIRRERAKAPRHAGIDLVGHAKGNVDVLVLPDTYRVRVRRTPHRVNWQSLQYPGPDAGLFENAIVAAPVELPAGLTEATLEFRTTPITVNLRDGNDLPAKNRHVWIGTHDIDGFVRHTSDEAGGIRFTAPATELEVWSCSDRHRGSPWLGRSMKGVPGWTHLGTITCVPGEPREITLKMP